MFNNLRRAWIAPAVLVLAIAVYFVPPIHSRLSHRIDDLRTQIKYIINPPQDAVFLPTQQAAQQAAIDSIVSATMEAHALAQTPAPTDSASSTQGGPTAPPTATSTPLPSSVKLPGVVYVDQSGGYNLCAPANLTMALKFWGWKGSRDDVIRVVKPGVNDPSLN
ncbi:MAG TPA: hypothetical protein VF784_11905, partial [Anaerolineales bacterium]